MSLIFNVDKKELYVIQDLIGEQLFAMSPTALEIYKKLIGAYYTRDIKKQGFLLRSQNTVVDSSINLNELVALNREELLQLYPHIDLLSDITALSTDVGMIRNCTIRYVVDGTDGNQGKIYYHAFNSVQITGDKFIFELSSEFARYLDTVKIGGVDRTNSNDTVRLNFSSDGL